MASSGAATVLGPVGCTSRGSTPKASGGKDFGASVAQNLPGRGVGAIALLKADGVCTVVGQGVGVFTARVGLSAAGWTCTTKVSALSATLPVTCQQPSVGKSIAVA